MPCPGLSSCRVDCLHRAMVEGYRDARHADLLAEEAATMGWPTEVREYRQAGRTRDFHRWLTSGGWEPWRLPADDPGLDYDPQAVDDDEPWRQQWTG